MRAMPTSTTAVRFAMTAGPRTVLRAALLATIGVVPAQA